MEALKRRLRGLRRPQPAVLRRSRMTSSMPSTCMPGGGSGRRWNSTSRRRHVHQRAGVEIVEVVVRVGVRIEPAAVVAHRKLADEPGGREQIERVVDRGLRDPQPLAAQAREDLLGGKVLRTSQQQRGDAQSLRGGPYAMPQQSLVQAPRARSDRRPDAACGAQYTPGVTAGAQMAPNPPLLRLGAERRPREHMRHAPPFRAPPPGRLHPDRTLFALAVLAIVAALGAPSLQDTLRRGAIRAATLQLAGRWRRRAPPPSPPIAAGTFCLAGATGACLGDAAPAERWRSSWTSPAVRGWSPAEPCRAACCW